MYLFMDVRCRRAFLLVKQEGSFLFPLFGGMASLEEGSKGRKIFLVQRARQRCEGENAETRLALLFISSFGHRELLNYALLPRSFTRVKKPLSLKTREDPVFLIIDFEVNHN